MKINPAIAATALLMGGCAAAPVNFTAKSNPVDETAEPVTFFVIGDTGVVGSEGNLPLTSQLVKQVCAAAAGCDFGVMTGDNIYPSGATGDPTQDAPVFEALFLKPFGGLWSEASSSRLFVALGNHDWYNGRSGAEAQLRFHQQHRPFFMGGFSYRQRVEVHGVRIDLFVIDTEMLLSTQTLPQYKMANGGSMVASGETEPGGTEHARPASDNERNQTDWLDKELAASTADWKIVLGHHPLWQSRGDSKFAQSARLRKLILPALCRNADVYLAGHQHSIEVHEDTCGSVKEQLRPLPQVVSGAGAKARSIDPDFQAWQAAQFPQDRPLFAKGDTAGFVQVTLNGREIRIVPITASTDGEVIRHKAITFHKRTAP